MHRALRRFGDGVAETLRHAGIAPVVHVQPVGRHERLERQVIDVTPVAHQLETAEQVDILLLRGRGDKRNHGLGVRLGNDLRRELRIDQHDIGADRMDLREPLTDQQAMVAKLMTADDRVCAELPEHQIGLGSDDGRIKPRQHVADFFAVHATIVHCERRFREMLLEFDRKPARIIGGWRTCARTRRR